MKSWKARPVFLFKLKPNIIGVLIHFGSEVSIKRNPKLGVFRKLYSRAVPLARNYTSDLVIYPEMFSNIISKRALSMWTLVGSQVRPLTSIYGVELKSTANFSYSAAVLSKDLQNDCKAEPFYRQKVYLKYIF